MDIKKENIRSDTHRQIDIETVKLFAKIYCRLKV